MARLGIRAVRTVARFAEQQQRARERELRQTSKDEELRHRKQPGQSVRPARPGPHGVDGADDAGDAEASTPVCQPEFAMPVNADGEIPDEFLPKI